MILADIFLGFMFLLLIIFGVLGFLAWQKISIFLTWNTSYQTADYERAVATPKRRETSRPASLNESKGRSIKAVDDLVDITDLDFETGYKALEELGK